MARESRLDDSQATDPEGHGANAGCDEEVTMPTWYDVDDDDTFDDDEELDDEEVVDDDEWSDWTTWDVPDSDRELLLPPNGPSDPEWDQVVTSHERAFGSHSSYGPVSWDRIEELCSVDDVWFIAHLGDSGFHITVLGEFTDPFDAYEALARASDAFTLDAGGAPVSLLSVDDDDLDDESWDPDLDEPDVVAPPLPGPRPRLVCGTSRALGRRTGPRRRSGTEQDYLELCATVITHDDAGVIVAGPDASPTLPGPGTWHVVPTDGLDEHDLRAKLDCWAATVQVHDAPPEAALLVRGIGPMVAARLAHAGGSDHAWQLTEDALKLIDARHEVFVATTLRVQPPR